MSGTWSALNNNFFFPLCLSPPCWRIPGRTMESLGFIVHTRELQTIQGKKSKHGGKWGSHCLSGVTSCLSKHPLWNNGHLTLTSVVMHNSCAELCSGYHPIVRLLSLNAFNLMRDLAVILSSV